MSEPLLLLEAAKLMRERVTSDEVLREDAATWLDVADVLDIWSCWTGNPADLDLIDSVMSVLARHYLGRTA